MKLFNNFNRTDTGDCHNYFYIVPKIIIALNLCDKFLEYPLSVAEAVFNATEISPIFEDFRTKSRTNWQLFTKVIKNSRNRVINVIKNQDFSRKNTIPMQTIINELDKLVK